MGEHTSKDLEFWHAFNADPNKSTFNTLYNHMKPIIHTAIGKAKIGSNLPASAFDMEAANQFLKTVQTYDPNKGSLATKVFSDMRKVHRLNTDYQNLARITESRIFEIGPVQTAKSYLEAKLGREPSIQEIADEAGLPVKTVALLHKETRADLMHDDMFEHEVFTTEDVEDTKRATEVYHELTGQDQNVFDYMTGLHGRPSLRVGNKPDWNRIAKATGLNEEQVKKARKNIMKVWNKYA